VKILKNKKMERLEDSKNKILFQVRINKHEDLESVTNSLTDIEIRALVNYLQHYIKTVENDLQIIQTEFNGI